MNTLRTKTTILTIDDESLIRETFEDFLGDMGYRVLQASDGPTGLDIFCREWPDIVLLDLTMPRMNGLEVLKIIREESPDTPVIIVSGTGMLQDAIDAMRLGAWDFLTKPIADYSLLAHTLEITLERARLLVENRRYKEHLEEEILIRTAELDEAKELIEDLVNASNDTALLLDENGVILAANEVASARLGYSRQTLVGQNVYALLPRDIATRRKRIHDETLSTGRPVRYEDERNGLRFDVQVAPLLSTSQSFQAAGHLRPRHYRATGDGKRPGRIRGIAPSHHREYLRRRVHHR